MNALGREGVRILAVGLCLLEMGKILDFISVKKCTAIVNQNNLTKTFPLKLKDSRSSAEKLFNTEKRNFMQNFVFYFEHS